MPHAGERPGLVLLLIYSLFLSSCFPSIVSISWVSLCCQGCRAGFTDEVRVFVSSWSLPSREESNGGCAEEDGQHPLGEVPGILRERGGFRGRGACGPGAQGLWLIAGWKEGVPPQVEILHPAATVALERVSTRARGQAGSRAVTRPEKIARGPGAPHGGEEPSANSRPRGVVCSSGFTSLCLRKTEAERAQLTRAFGTARRARVWRPLGGGCGSFGAQVGSPARWWRLPAWPGPWFSLSHRVSEDSPEGVYVDGVRSKHGDCLCFKEFITVNRLLAVTTP